MMLEEMQWKACLDLHEIPDVLVEIIMTRCDWVLGKKRTGLELREVLHKIRVWERALQGLTLS